jgi:enoyl-CoA hydratase/carnithine racemase
MNLKEIGTAVKAMLESIVGFETKTLEQSLMDERAAVHANSGTADANEGIMAFLEKRKPVFNQS